MNIDFLDNWKSQTKKGLITLMVLKIIKSKSCYGGEIIKEVKERFGFQIAEGTLYPILKKLKIQKLVMSNWKTEENDIGAPKKFYMLTGEGRLMLTSMNGFWSNINESMYSIAS
ncbi:MAG: PadR family transcriptional regulator PadR [Planctomycetota bacterium]|jgi:PadR family transcriptional regulator PadR